MRLVLFISLFRVGRPAQWYAIRGRHFLPVRITGVKRILFTLLGLLWLTLAHAQHELQLYVAADGSAAYRSIQAAIDDTKAFPSSRITIFIKAGVYEEKVKVHAWNNLLTLKGEGAANTILRWDDHFTSIGRGRNSTFHTPTLLVQGAGFRAEDLTIENSAGPVGQAIALAVEADNCEIIRCRLLGNQDTLYAAGANARQYYSHCYIEGTTDFIFGGATALFEDCVVHSKANSYVTAASTPQGARYGFVFLNCRLTAAPGVNKVYLGRPWRDYAKTVFVGCTLSEHILPEGWDNWGSTKKETSSFYAEYGNSGPGAAAGNRVAWSHQLSRRQAKRYRKQLILTSP
ncbi:MAG: pectinesterase family protein [Lewinella sp.]